MIWWHASFMALYADADLLERSIGRDGREVAEQAKKEIDEWATSSEARKGVLHALLVLKHLEMLPIGSDPAIHVPKAVFYAAMAVYSYIKFMPKTGSCYTPSQDEIAIPELQVSEPVGPSQTGKKQTDASSFPPVESIRVMLECDSNNLQDRVESESATALLALVAAVNGKVIRGRQLSGAAAVPANPQPANLTSGGDYVSTDMSSLESNTEQYYLGFREVDFEKPYAKYYNPVVSPISDALVNGLAGSPWPSAFTYSAQDAAKYLEQPGYLNLENGYAIGSNGTLMIAVRSEIPQVTGEQYDWWFGWHSVETARYKLWNPIAHQYSYRTPDSVDWANRTYAERYIGATSYIDEYVGNDAAKLSIQFIEPESIGFNTSAWPELGIETVVVGKLFIGDYSLEEFDQTSYLMHMVRRMPNGYRELRSRFFVASDNHGNAQLGHDLAVHCNIEMTHLGSFLPALFQEFKGTK
ncbi:hypothetical protein K4K60_009522 [Colletotrichum sp. SAR11_57]|nr:hypothetical protein K4K60_009522 [Colletotrichum sp. SAR11_57]